MKSFKLSLSDSDATKLIRTHYKDAEQIAPIDMGELSKVYQFQTDDNAYVVHFRLNEESLLKAETIYEQFGSLLAIPRTLLRGTENGVHYLISQKADGAPVSSLTEEKQSQISTHLADVYSQINETKTSAAFGIIEPGKQPSDTSWRDTLERFFH